MAAFDRILSGIPERILSKAAIFYLLSDKKRHTDFPSVCPIAQTPTFEFIIERMHLKVKNISFIG